MIDPQTYYTLSPYSAGSLSQEEQLRFIDRFKKFPESIRNLLADVETAEYIWTLGNTNSFTVEQMTALAITIRELAVGTISLATLPQVLVERIGFDQNYSKQLAQFITNDLLTPALEDIKKIQQEMAPRQPTPFISSQETNKNNIIDLRDTS